MKAYEIVIISDVWPLPQPKCLSKRDDEKAENIVNRAIKVIINLPPNFNYNVSELFVDFTKKVQFERDDVKRFKIKSKSQLALYHILFNSTSSLSCKKIYQMMTQHPHFVNYKEKSCSSDLQKMIEKGIASRKKNTSVYEFYLTDENKKKFKQICYDN